MAPLLAWGVASLFLLLPTSSASTATVTANVSFSSAELGGRLQARSSPIELLLLDQGNGSFEWRLSASTVVANLTREAQVEAGRPSNNSQVLGTVSKGPASYSEAQFRQAKAASKASGIESHAIVTPLGGAAPNLATASGPVLLTPVVPWDALNRTEGRDDVKDSGLVWLIQDNGSLIVSGNFSLTIWHGVVAVNNATKNETYISGNWTEGVGPGPSGQGHAIRERHSQIVRLDVSEGILEIQSLGRAAIVATPVLGIDHVTDLALQDLRANFANGSKTETETWRIAGPVSLSVTRDRMTNLLVGTISGGPAAFAHQAQVPALAPRTRDMTEQRTSPGVLLAVLPVSLGLFIGVAAFHVSKTPSIAQAEFALLSRRFRKAARLSGRIVKRYPGEPNALFLLAASLATVADYSRILTIVGPRAEHVAARSRTALSFLLAVAAARCGRSSEAIRWAADAVRDPTLRRQLQQEGIVLDGSSPQTGYA